MELRVQLVLDGGDVYGLKAVYEQDEYDWKKVKTISEYHFQAMLNDCRQMAKFEISEEELTPPQKNRG